MTIDKAKFLAMCGSLDEVAETDLAAADRELLLVLHRALSELKDTVEKTLLAGRPEERLVN